MALNGMTSGSPFDGFFKTHLPQFFFEKFKGTDLQRIEALLENFEIVFDNVYQKLNGFSDELDVRTAEVEYLYQLGKLLGILDIDDMSKYLDSDGNVDIAKITQEDFDDAVIRQRSYIANTIGRYLLKGTVESIKRLLYSKGLDVSLRELWTEDVINGPFFEYSDALAIQYGDAITGSPSGDVYSEESFDLIAEISGDIEEVGF